MYATIGLDRKYEKFQHSQSRKVPSSERSSGESNTNNNKNKENMELSQMYCVPLSSPLILTHPVKWIHI